MATLRDELGLKIENLEDTPELKKSVSGYFGFLLGLTGGREAWYGSRCLYPALITERARDAMKHTKSERERERISGGEPNFVNRTLFHGDNLNFLRGMNSETVHLIATDPPFNKNKDFHATPDSLSGGAKFKDRWDWEQDVHESWIDQIHDNWPATEAVIASARQAYGGDMAAFLCWLGVRLMEMRRILRKDGSIYLHIDHTAHAYVKALMDSIFGARNFRNEIVWCYSGGGVPKRDFPRKHDTLLRYAKTNDYVFHVERKSYKQNTQDVGIHSTYVPDNKIDLERGTPVTDWWEDIPTTTGWSPENYGYPTQKPLTLYSRIIRASSNPDDIVLDPFCGCATTLVAAELLGRRWVGMDIWEGAHQAVLDRLSKQGLAVPSQGTGNTSHARLFTFGNVTLSKRPPERTDEDEIPVPVLRLRFQRPKEPWQKLTNKAMRNILADAQSPRTGFVDCAGCGRTLETEFTELDHIQPKAEGGDNFITNRVLLCAPCNKTKSDRLTITGVIKENRKTGWLHDQATAKTALDKAKQTAEEIRDTWDVEDIQLQNRKDSLISAGIEKLL